MIKQQIYYIERDLIYKINYNYWLNINNLIIINPISSKIRLKQLSKFIKNAFVFYIIFKKYCIFISCNKKKYLKNLKINFNLSSTLFLNEKKQYNKGYYNKNNNFIYLINPLLYIKNNFYKIKQNFLIKNLISINFKKYNKISKLHFNILLSKIKLYKIL